MYIFMTPYFMLKYPVLCFYMTLCMLSYVCDSLVQLYDSYLYFTGGYRT